MKHFVLYIGKVFVGLVFVTSAVISLVLIIGFFMQGMEREYFERNRVFFVATTAVAVVSFFPAWRWKKEIWADVAALLPPF